MDKKNAIRHANAIKNECSKHKDCEDCPFFNEDEDFCGIQEVPLDWTF